MIVRLWRCFITHENVPLYVEHFQQSVLPELKQINGFVEGTILQRAMDVDVEITVLTYWESMDAVHNFAGEQADTAVVAPAAQSLVRAYDTLVTHYEVLLNTGRNTG